MSNHNDTRPHLVRYQDLSGVTRSKHFQTKDDANAYQIVMRDSGVAYHVVVMPLPREALAQADEVTA